jgi:hypothetical protein
MHITDDARPLCYSRVTKRNPLIFFTTRRGRSGVKPGRPSHSPNPARLQETQDVVEVEVEDWEGKEKAVDSIERSPVAG